MVTAVVAAVVALTGCASPATAPAGTIGVVATTTQLGDFVRQIGGAGVVVTQLLSPGVDPHDYEPSPADLTAVAGARLVVRNGVGLDRWLDAAVTAAAYTGPVIDASTGVTLRRGAGGEADPHIWQSPVNAAAMVATIVDALAAADPAHATAYRDNGADYRRRLDRLDASIAARIDTIPVARRKLVTNHDAFGYYVQRYHLEFVGSIIPSFDSSAELSATQIDDLVARIRATGVRAVFSESSLPPKTAEAIAAQAGVRVEAGEDSLFADTLGPAGSAGATYVDAMNHNTDVITAALRGD